MASTEWYVISLRPRGGHAALRAAVARHGGRVLALSPWRLRALDDATTHSDLRAARACERILFTSPAAVRCAALLAPLQRRRGQTWLAVGEGTAAALLRAGIDTVTTPTRQDSEGLLALPTLQDLHDVNVGLVTAPGGRGLLAETLRQRGAVLHRADVYVREALPLSPQALQCLANLRAPYCLALSSGEALNQVLAQLPDKAKTRLLRASVVAASERLAEQARKAGFTRIIRSEGPQPAQLAKAAANLLSSNKAFATRC
ncbi:MAG: uroporphyrinogen-III synthase [Pseudoxanthomonas sp.]